MGDTILDALRSRAGRAMEWMERDLARRRLLRMSDRALADMSFSRERLEAGVRAWPWRTEDGAQGTVAASARRPAVPNVTSGPAADADRVRTGLEAVPARAATASDDARHASEGRLAA